VNQLRYRLTSSFFLFCLLLWPGYTASAAEAQTSLRGPDVTIIAEKERTVFEYRQGSELRMIKVVPKIGKPYFLVPADDTRGFGDLEQADMLLPRWILVEF